MAEKQTQNLDIHPDEKELENEDELKELDGLLSDNDEKDKEDESFLDDLDDFNDFSIDDLDTALSKFEKTRKQTASAPVQKVSDLSFDSSDKIQKKDAKHTDEIFEESTDKFIDKEDEPFEPDLEFDDEEKTDFDEKFSDTEFEQPSFEPRNFDPSSRMDNSVEAEKNVFITKVDKRTVDQVLENGSIEYSLSDEQEQKLKNLRWYDGKLKEKVYEVSLYNMPEFLDYNKDIRTIHVNIDSSYGWNVFFENGVFMNLMDLKEYQERNGKLPGRNGKIIYGSKTTTFEKIEKIVVFQKPRYFSYAVEK